VFYYISLSSTHGETINYVNAQYVWTTVKYNRTPTSIQVSISSQGGYSLFPSKRNYVVEIINGLPLARGTVNGMSLSYARFGGPNTWRYDGYGVKTIIETSALSTAATVTVDITFVAAINDALMSGMKGGILHASWAKANFDESRVTPGAQSVQGGNISILASYGEELSYLAGTNIQNFLYIVQTQFALTFSYAVTEVKDMQSRQPLVQLWDSQREDNCLCGSLDCMQANSYYQQLRIEGFQPKMPTSNTINLNDWWDPTVTDNWATTNQGNPANGYQNANFADGLVLIRPEPNTSPLVLYYSADRQDYLTVGTPAGNEYAKTYGYALVNSTLGYVYNSPDLSAVNFQRWAHSMQLLLTAYN